MKTIGFTAELESFNGKFANIGILKEVSTKDTYLIAMSYEAILRCMKETNRKAFYMAMSNFVDDEEYNDACRFLEGMENE